MAGLATSYFVAMVMTIRESPVVAVAELVIRLTPGALVERAIRVLGHHDKTFLVIVLLLLGAWPHPRQDHFAIVTAGAGVSTSPAGGTVASGAFMSGHSTPMSGIGSSGAVGSSSAEPGVWAQTASGDASITVAHDRRSTTPTLPLDLIDFEPNRRS